MEKMKWKETKKGNSTAKKKMYLEIWKWKLLEKSTGTGKDTEKLWSMNKEAGKT